MLIAVILLAMMAFGTAAGGAVQILFSYLTS
jgi:hypothetical protein